ncbi:MAG: MaoC family dehydratase [Candidatus Accumulibacter phosphatis]|uniref:MaoC family dehydratase n=1 Tax=Candidatus Accumulibacter contiguus TaxID=2954381 RepID=A0ABX1T4V4_9PROT|nr:MULTISPECIES: MaoC family dehydratase [Candidatus Accumulibacter]MBL8408654.1 MaoC family dehydratase [Accumulibacter sp.]NMQ04675.1 MaoC family dehydratase [Candidatus Accumulibacter contiguus]HRF13440.1 MaoC family dehydratase [Candidatus Accumulibacter phosphatis]
MSEKTRLGNFFEDFYVGQTIAHATPRTITEGDVALYTALTGSRFATTSADTFAHSLGFPRAPVDDFLAFNMVFGRTVPDISINAVANLGYATGRFGHPVYPGDTLSADSTVIGLKENSDGQTGVVYVRSCGVNQRGQIALDYCRWVMVRKRDPASPAPESVVPDLPAAIAASDLLVPTGIRIEQYDTALSGSTDLWNDYQVGERIDHVDGMTIEESEHMMATRLYQNTARVHFNQQAERAAGRFGRRLIYGGHIISLARSLSYNGLANAFSIAAINGGRHVTPAFAGDTVYAWSEVLEQLLVPGRKDIGALRLRTVATKDQPCADFPYQTTDGRYDPSVLLDFDYTVLMPRRE